MSFDFDNLPKLNWENFEETSMITSDICKRMGGNKDFLRQLVENVEKDPILFDLCEEHELDDKIVIYNNLEDGYRIRLRLANVNQYERAHNHRFPFTTYILHGTYYQQWYNIKGVQDEGTKVKDVERVCTRIEKAGSVFTISDTAIHSTQTEPYTVSLVICGPPKKDKAFIINMKSGEVWYKLGKKLETQEQQKKVKMSKEKFKFWKSKLEEFNLI